MISPSEFHDIVSGRRRGAKAALLRAGMRAAEVPYSWAMRIRNLRYDRGHAAIHQVAVPVISVGNLTMGGTGKTPMVAWLAEWFQSRNRRVAIISRGVGAGHAQSNDEAQELARRLPDVPHVQNPDRLAAANQAIAEQQAQIIVMDDGFQHRRLHRDLDIVLIDALQPFGFGHVFPRGSLREPLAGITRADVAVLTRSDCISNQEQAKLRRHFLTESPSLAWVEATHRPVGLATASGELARLASPWLSEQRVVAFCGIGNPSGFVRTLQICHCHHQELVEFPDHHAYSAADLRLVEAAIARHDASLVVCTEKDLVKLGLDRIGDCAVRALRIEMALEDPEEALLKRLTQFLD